MKKINLETLPQLTGTEKQIKWANEIREGRIKGLNECFEAGLYKDGYEAELKKYNEEKAKDIEEFIAEEGLDAAERMIRRFQKLKERQIQYRKYISFIAEKFATETSAKWWIEVGSEAAQPEKPRLGRLDDGWLDGIDRVNAWLTTQASYESIGSSVSPLYEEFKSWSKKQDLPAEVREELEAKEAAELEAALMVPEELATSTKASIEAGDNVVKVNSDKDSVVIKICKSLGYKWNDSNWYKKFYPSITDPSDAIAEIANGLLVAGVTVIVKDPEARRKAVDGTYEPIPTRVISGNKEEGKLYIRWDEYSNSIYSDARMIKGSKWNNPSVEVSPEEYLDIEGFAEKWGFVLTPTAQDLIDEAKAKMAAATVKVTKGKEYVPAEFNGEAVLQSEATVLDKHKLI